MNTRQDLEAEMAYIEARAQDKDFGSFNDDAECFYRYCTMQSRAAARAGFPDLADRMQDVASAVVGNNTDPAFAHAWHPGPIRR